MLNQNSSDRISTSHSNACLQVLIDWINSELEEERIIVKDLEEDCYDGQVLQKLFGEKEPIGALTYHPACLDRCPLRIPAESPSSQTKPIMSLVSPTEKLSGRKLNVAEVTQSEIGQKQKLQTVLEAVNELLRPHGWTIEWSVDCECQTSQDRSPCLNISPGSRAEHPLRDCGPWQHLPIYRLSYPFKEPGGHRLSAGCPGDALPGSH